MASNKETKTTVTELKNKIEKVVLESYKRTRDKNFSDLNYVFQKSKSAIAFLKEKLKAFNNLDEYSATFLSIYTRAKVTLREFQDQNFEGNHLELLRLILTLPDILSQRSLKSTKVEIKKEVETKIERKLLLDDEKVVIPTQKNKSVYAKQGVTGKKLTKQKTEKEIELVELNEIDFEDEEFENEIDNLDDIKF